MLDKNIAAAGIVGLTTLIGIVAASKKPAEAHPSTDILYTCSYCGEIFDTRKKLLQHFETAHSGQTPIITYTCAVCDEDFATLAELLQHIEIEHPEGTPTVLFPSEDAYFTELELAEDTVYPGDRIYVTGKIHLPAVSSIEYVIGQVLVMGYNAGRGMEAHSRQTFPPYEGIYDFSIDFPIFKFLNSGTYNIYAHCGANVLRPNCTFASTRYYWKINTDLAFTVLPTPFYPPPGRY